MDSLGFTWIHLDSLGLTWTHLVSLGLTWSHLDSLGFTWTHNDSLGPTTTHQNSLELTRSHQDSLEPHKTRTTYHPEPNPEPKREKEKGPGQQFFLIPTSLSDRAYARTNETKRFPDCAPPTSDIGGCVCVIPQTEEPRLRRVLTL